MEYRKSNYRMISSWTWFCLQKVKDSLNALKPSVDEIEYERDGVMRWTKREQGDQVRRVVDKLREEWSQVNRGYTERHK